MNNHIWKPAKDKKKNSLLMNFTKYVELKTKSFKDVWRWSVENPKKNLVKILGLFKNNRKQRQ